MHSCQRIRPVCTTSSHERDTHPNVVALQSRCDIQPRKPFSIEPGTPFGTLNPDVSKRQALVIATSQPTDYLHLDVLQTQASLLRTNTQELQRQPLFQYFVTNQLREFCKPAMCKEMIFKPGAYIIRQVKVGLM